MSQWDVDDVSLPSTEAESSTTSMAQAYQRPPYGTLQLPKDDELLTVAQLAQELEQAQGRYHRLTLSHAELGDDRFQRVLDLLRKTSESVEQSEDGKAAAAVETSQLLQESKWPQVLASLLKAWKIRPRPPYYCMRVLELDNNELTSRCLPAITTFLTDNFVIHTLELRGNSIEGDVDAFRSLALAVGRSTLRHLALSNNPILHESIAAFFDSIPSNGTSLERLDLSRTFLTLTETERVDRQPPDVVLVAGSIASFLADRQRCRSLFSLDLNGNSLGERGIRTVIGAVAGSASRYQPKRKSIPLLETQQGTELQQDPFFAAVFAAKPRPPNRSLLHLGLSGNMQPGWLQVDPQIDRERRDAIRRRYSPVPAAELETIVEFLDTRAREKRLKGAAYSDGDIPLEVARHLPTIGVTLDEWESDFQEAWEFGAGIKSSKRSSIFALNFARTLMLGQETREAARGIVKAARVLGCRARRRDGGSSAAPSDGSEALPGFHRFLDLPPELRLHVLRQLDEYGRLTAPQFEKVISFACDPSTIGYGERDFDWTSIVGAANGDTSYQEDTSSTLPAAKWSWNDCFANRALPRDWEADVLDASRTYERLQYRRVIAHEQDSWDPIPGMHAFLESTLTHRAEE